MSFMKTGTICSLLMTTSFATPVFSQSEGVMEQQGVWFGGYRRGREEISIEMKIIQDVGMADIKFKGWEPVGHSICQYVFDASTDGTIEPKLNESAGTPANCPQGWSFDFSRVGPDNAVARFSKADFLSEAELAAGLRPFTEDDRRSPVDGLDILGVATGMTKSEVETKLSSVGYEPTPEGSRVAEGRSGSWTQETSRFVRQEEEDGKWGDTFTVQYSSMLKTDSSEPRAAIIARNWSVPADQGLSQLTLLKALEDKYGPTLRSGLDRSWDRSGNNLTESAQKRQMCANGSLQMIDYSFNAARSSYNSRANLYCGPEAAIQVYGDSTSGTARSLSIRIVDPDELWGPFWNTWSEGQYSDLKTLYDNVSKATGAAPEL